MMVTISEPVLWPDKYHDAVWHHEAWGQYRGQDPFNHHWLLPVLSVVAELDKNWRSRKDNEAYIQAQDFFSDVRFAEQAFGMSWLCKVSYTLDDRGYGDPEMLKMPAVKNSMRQGYSLN